MIWDQLFYNINVITTEMKREKKPSHPTFTSENNELLTPQIDFQNYSFLKEINEKNALQVRKSLSHSQLKE